MDTVLIKGRKVLTLLGIQHLLKEHGWEYSVTVLGSCHSFTATKGGTVFMFSMGKEMIKAEIGTTRVPTKFSDDLIRARFLRISFGTMQQQGHIPQINF